MRITKCHHCGSAVSDAMTSCALCHYPNVNFRHHEGFFHRWFKSFVIISIAFPMIIGTLIVLFVIGGLIYSGTEAGKRQQYELEHRFDSPTPVPSPSPPPRRKARQ